MSSEKGAVQSELNPNRLNDEHSTQIQLMESLLDAIDSCSDKSQIIKNLDQLLSYTGLHFLSEQLLMQQYSYQKYDEHTEDHARIMERLRDTQQQFHQQPVESYSAEIDSLRELIVGHIGTHDRLLHKFLIETAENAMSAT